QALHPALVRDAGLRSRLERQAELAVRLKHKNIVETCGLFALPGSDELGYLVEEQTGGHNLRQMLEHKRAQGRCFSPKSAYNVVAHLCNALTYAHTTLTHGAVVAESVWVSPAGRVKLGDFGVGGVLATLEPVRKRIASALTPLAPEVLAGQTIDPRADI